MKFKYINKIKANIYIYSNKKSANILDGTYKSVYKGKSMNFENLREYVINDDVKDIDWKASSRCGNLLVKQFVAEKKHNVLLLVDSGIKMKADTNKNVSKKDVSLYTAGTIGYLTVKNGDYVGITYSSNNEIIYKPFKNNLYNLESYLNEYNKIIENDNNIDINKMLEYVYKNIHKRMIIFVITDIDGINSISERTLKEITNMHDVLCININDNFMCGEEMYDIENKSYIPKLFLKDKKLNELEKNIRENLINDNLKKLRKNKVSMTTISSNTEITNKLIKLLEEHRYASNS